MMMYYTSYESGATKSILVEDCSLPSVEIQEHIGGMPVVRLFRVLPHCSYSAEVLVVEGKYVRVKSQGDLVTLQLLQSGFTKSF